MKKTMNTVRGRSTIFQAGRCGRQMPASVVLVFDLDLDLCLCLFPEVKHGMADKHKQGNHKYARMSIPTRTSGVCHTF